jgi:hypothetical protein
MFCSIIVVAIQDMLAVRKCCVWWFEIVGDFGIASGFS